MKIDKIRLSDNSFPKKLSQIPDYPSKIFVLGDLNNALKNPCLSIVGTRKVTAYGRGVTEKLAAAAAGKGITIISGLALGVDSIAHKAALDAGGKTVAILPCGLDKPYPASHRGLARRIIESGGALISEYPNGTPPLQHNFIARNRLVSALGDAVLITEAAAKSGTMHTVNFALDQGKTVMAVPGNITSTMSEGANQLIKTGAIPVTTPQDIFDALQIGVQMNLDEVLAANEQEAAILNRLKSGMADGDEIQADSGLSASEFNQTLTMLEISGKIRSTGAGKWTIC